MVARVVSEGFFAHWAKNNPPSPAPAIAAPAAVGPPTLEGGQGLTITSAFTPCRARNVDKMVQRRALKKLSPIPISTARKDSIRTLKISIS